MCEILTIILLAGLVDAESRGECFTGKYLVASTVVNRMRDPRWPNTIEEVIYQPGQYAAPRRRDKVGGDSYKAAVLALHKPHPGVYYFYNPATATDRRFTRSLCGCWDVGRHRFCADAVRTNIRAPQPRPLSR